MGAHSLGDHFRVHINTRPHISSLWIEIFLFSPHVENWTLPAKVVAQNEFSAMHFSFGGKWNICFSNGKSENDYERHNGKWVFHYAFFPLVENPKLTTPLWKIQEVLLHFFAESLKWASPVVGKLEIQFYIQILILHSNSNSNSNSNFAFQFQFCFLLYIQSNNFED